jgi:KDO2-lipid IV(A) lauroyltransferase
VAKYFFLPRKLAKRRPEFNTIGWRIESWGIGAFVGILKRMPLERATRFAHRLFATFSGGSGSKRRQRVVRNLLVAFPEQTGAERDRLTRDIFGYVGAALAEIVHMPTIWRERATRLEFVASPEIRFLRERGKPAVLVTAHIGPWTLTNFCAGHFGFPLSIVYAPESNPHMDELMFELRSALPVTLLSRDNSMRALIGALSRGEAIGLGSDVRLDSGEMIPFFGHPMPTNTVPARLALRFDCELIAVRAERLPGGRFRVTLCAPVRPDDPSANPNVQAVDMTTKLNAQFEQWIRETPAEWLCLARRWPKHVERAAEEAAHPRSAVGGPA